MSKEQHEAKKEAIAELNRISKANGGKITAEQLVDAARDENSPLHEYFEWDDEVAGQKYRLVQARTLIRSCHYRFTVENHKVEIPYYIRDPEAESMNQGYVEVARVRNQEDIAREALIREFSRVAAQLRRAKSLAMFFSMQEDIEQLIDVLGILRERVTIQEPAQAQ